MLSSSCDAEKIKAPKPQLAPPNASIFQCNFPKRDLVVLLVFGSNYLATNSRVIKGRGIHHPHTTATDRETSIVAHVP